MFPRAERTNKITSLHDAGKTHRLEAYAKFFGLSKRCPGTILPISVNGHLISGDLDALTTLAALPTMLGLEPP
jgi:hypothetical protein